MLLVAIFIAVSVTGDDGGDDQVVTAGVEVVGDPLPTGAGSPDDPAVGLPAPEVAGTDLSGAPLVLGPDDGPRAIVFLAHWCPHCQAEVADLTAWLGDNELPEGVEIQSVSTLVDPSRGNFPPAEWLENAGWPYPVLVDDADSTVAEAFGLDGTPFWVFVDADGRVVERVSGELSPDDLAARLAALASAT